MSISLKKINIKNFKAWENTGDINFADITMLYWTNSAWKSSIIQFLLLLKQTIESSDNQRVLLSSHNWIIDLWTITDFFTQHDLSRKITFDLWWDSNTFQSTIKTRKIWNEKFWELVVESLKYSFSNWIKTVSLTENEDWSYKLDSQKFDLKRKQWRAWPLPKPLKFYKFPQETFEYYQNAWDIFGASFELEKLFQKIIYIWPIRHFPKRIYEWSWEKPSNVWIDGGDVVNVMLSAENEWISLRMWKWKKAKKFMFYIAEWLRKLWLVEDFRINKISEDSKVYKLEVQITKKSSWVDIADVWFGVSQILPILVQSFYAERGSIIILEQPEIHLHPRVQSILADVFIEASKDRGIQFIIESHSEHLLRRMQLRIAEEKINFNFIKTYFCKSVWGKSVIENLETDKYGNIINWPDNFFGDDVKEMEDFLLAQINTKKNEKS